MSKLRNELLQEMQYRNYSPRTIGSYLSCLSKLSIHFDQCPSKISIDQIKSYLHYYVSKKKASTSFVNQTISVLKLLHVSILKREWDPMTIARPRREKRLPVVLSREEISQMLAATYNLKHRSILMLAYSSGLRIGEVINLKLQDIDSNRMQVRISMGKGKKDRYTILSGSTLKLLRQYYTYYQPRHWLFEGPMFKQYSTSSIQKIFKRSCKKINLNKAVYFHCLRHSFATHLLEQGVSIQILQHLLGHSNPKTTCVYLHVQQYSLDKVTSPLDYQIVKD